MGDTHEAKVNHAGDPGGGRLGKVVSLLRFAWARGGSFPDFARLFYLTAIKPGIVYRRVAKFHPENVYCLPLRLRPGKLWNVYVRDNGHDAPMLIEFFCKRRLFEGEEPPYEPKVIYDLGANIGIASLFFASVYPRARIYGFEPVPEHFEICRQNYLNLDGAQAFNWAVGQSSGKRVFEFSESDIRAGHLVAGNGKPSSVVGRRFSVDAFSIEDLVRKTNLAPPDFIKVDVEGAELEVLKGLGTSCENIQYIHLETHSPELEEQCVRWLKTNNFEIAGTARYTDEFGAVWARKRSLGRSPGS